MLSTPLKFYQEPSVILKEEKVLILSTERKVFYCMNLVCQGGVGGVLVDEWSSGFRAWW